VSDPAERALDDLVRLLLAMLVARLVSDGALSREAVLATIDRSMALLQAAGQDGAPPIVARPIDDAELETYRVAAEGARDRVVRTFGLLMGGG
jgi:hypothetical protein